MARYRKRPVVIDAVQWTEALQAFAGSKFDPFDDPCEEDGDATAAILDDLHSTWVLLHTNDWIIKGLKGEFYPCRHEVFLESYEPAEPVE